MYWQPYVSVGARRTSARQHAKFLANNGRTVSPVIIDGNKITKTFWGNAWCKHLESFSDMENRLPRGRSYVRNGLIVDLQILPGKVVAQVMGSSPYDVEISVGSLSAPQWQKIIAACRGNIASVVDLLQGKLSDGVMQVITARETGLFPLHHEIEMTCTCPDYADMCKHIAATLYGLGARLDVRPELLFVLRQVDHLELISQAAVVDAIANANGGGESTIDAEKLSDVFGVDLVDSISDAGAAVSANGAGSGPSLAPAMPPVAAAKPRGTKACDGKAAARPSAAKSRAAKPAPRKAKTTPQPFATTVVGKKDQSAREKMRAVPALKSAARKKPVAKIAGRAPAN